MKREEKINKKVEEALAMLQQSPRYEGSPLLDARIKAAVGKVKDSESFFIWPRLAGVAAVALILLNVAVFTQAPVDESLTRTEGLDLLLDAYTVVPAAEWNNYLTIEDAE